MTYRVEITAKAESQAYDAFEFIARDSPNNATRWYRELLTAIRSLEQFPQRCPTAPEAKRARRELRHLIFGNYRIIFEIGLEEVHVLSVRHAARLPMSPEELES